MRRRSGKKKGYENIKVCERWQNSFKNFLEDMGERPEKMTLDRIDPFGNYEPNNCKWATWSEQNKNKRQEVKYEKFIYNYHTKEIFKTASECARHYNVSREFISQLLHGKCKLLFRKYKLIYYKDYQKWLGNAI